MPAGWEIAVDLLRTSRALVDELHVRLARRGHPELRPAHGYAFQTIGAGGVTATAIGEALGVTKQAAGQMVEELERLGYVRRAADARDARRKLVLLTDRGVEALRLSAEILDDLRDEWAAGLPPGALDQLDAALRVGAQTFGAGPGLRPVW